MFVNIIGGRKKIIQEQVSINLIIFYVRMSLIRFLIAKK